jgi:energy-coupling factor transport system substrate-specific component
MSWSLAAFALVIAALAGCFWWYERSRPPAKVVAVVATLAALAALGRDAFVALPDIKPTTAIALVAGFSFGAEVGFAVGAVGALASNVLLGQGPWTPWQMLAWGLVGIAGALLARATRRRIGRFGLALACAVAAEGFNLVMNLFTWTLGGVHTATAYGLVLTGALAFDVTHVVASFAFGFAFGPSLVRMLARVRARLEVTWRPVGALPAPVALVLVAALALGSVASGDSARASGAPPRARIAAGAGAGRQISFLTGAQNADGGFGAARGESTSELYTAWAALGLAAAGRNPADVRRNGHSALDALRAGAASLHGAGDLERTILALRACGASVRVLPGGDPVARLLRLRAADGSFGQLINLTAFGVFALRAAGYAPGAAPVRAAVRWLEREASADGGYSSTPGAPSDIDDTAAALQALAVGGARSSRSETRAVAYLIAHQNQDGGYPLEPGSDSNAQSTAFAVQALVAAGRNPAAVTRGGSRSPLGYLHSLVAPDGSVRYSRTSGQTPVWVTGQALLALASRPFPIAAPPRARRAASGRAAVKPGAARPRGAAAGRRAAAAQRRRDTRRTTMTARPGRPSAAASLSRRAGAVALAAGRLAGMMLGPLVA